MRYYLYTLIRQARPQNSAKWAHQILRWCMAHREAVPRYLLPSLGAALETKRPFYGHGEGYCYVWTRTHGH